MPDRDGISSPFADGRSYCHACDTWLCSHAEESEHRARCGRRWRKTVRRGRSEEEQLVLRSVEDS